MRTDRAVPHTSRHPLLTGMIFLYYYSHIIPLKKHSLRKYFQETAPLNYHSAYLSLSIILEWLVYLLGKELLSSVSENSDFDSSCRGYCIDYDNVSVLLNSIK